MGDRDQFGPSLRRERETRRVSLQAIAEATKVSIELWEGLERNDFSRWPSGVFARAFIRDYSRAVGLDADAVVNEFCLLFPLGDRRTNRLIEAQAEIIGHKPAPLETSEPLPAGRERRRARREAEAATPKTLMYRTRALAAGFDVVCVAGVGLGAASLVRGSVLAAIGLTALLYFTGGTVALGTSPGSHLLQRLRHRAPSLFASRRAVA